MIDQVEVYVFSHDIMTFSNLTYKLESNQRENSSIEVFIDMWFTTEAF